jgi:sirohydrochlorin cobaltochelatase
MAASLLLVAFGSTRPATTAVYQQLEGVAAAVVEGPRAWAWTSSRARTALAAAGQVADDPPAALARLERPLVVASLHVSSGGNHEALLAYDDPSAGVAVTAPIVDDPKHCDWLETAIRRRCRGSEPVLVAVHGSVPDGSREDPLALALTGRLRDLPQVAVACIEGRPGPDAALARLRPRAQAAGRAQVLPLLLAPGMHLERDLLGDEPESWASRLGVPCHAAPVLGLWPETAAIMHERLRTALGRLGQRAPASATSARRAAQLTRADQRPGKDQQKHR